MQALFQPSYFVAAVLFLVPLFLMGRLVWHLGSKLKK